MALVRSDVCGCLGAWECSADPLVELLGRSNWLAGWLRSRRLVSMVVFLLPTFGEEMIQYLFFACLLDMEITNQKKMWSSTGACFYRCLFLCSSIPEEHIEQSCGCHRCAALLLWQWSHLQLVTWMILLMIQKSWQPQFLLCCACSWTSMFIRRFMGHQVDYTSQVVQDFFNQQ